ncbi:ras-responsive element-binding protein 1-like isoform X2 [Patiria miniata]|nr:ras-responsive element-binding protein 1-like isoform X2 [Patiria miniata]XP_038068601.1 ras-responsive element-binding protein 1-like isoform X2 [Patiria miniata]XP_038068602.1 ras-responsive element-binding protein 1-like isoform X2 [Patiria miniata]
MDHKDRTVSVRETRSSTSGSSQNVTSTHKKAPKTKGVGLRGSPVKGERSGLRRTQRKNAAQRYKLGKIAAAEENKMIGAELRSERRRSTEVAVKGKAAVAKRTRSTGRVSTDSLGGDGVNEDDAIGTETEVGKASPRLMNGSFEPQVDDPPTPKSTNDDPAPNHQLPKRAPTVADSHLEPLNLATGTDSSSCPEPSGTGCAAKPQPSAEDDTDRASAFSNSSDSPHHQHPGTDLAHRHLCSDSTADTGSSPRATSEEVGAESGMRSDSPVGEQSPDPAVASAGETVMSTADGSEATQGSSKQPDGSISDDTSETSPWTKNVFKRRRPMEEGNTSLTCPVCSEGFEDKHHLTVHFREHNTITSDGTMHSCKLCGKKLSSTSSLDRHMLIHSGERPHRCPICPMSFTTNGNMRRHVRTHEKGASNGTATNTEGEYITETMYSKPRKRIPSKRLLSSEEPESDFFLSKRMALDNKDSPTKVRVKEEELTCPVCNKTFLCHYGLQTHMELHPNVVIKCDQCDATFKNHRGLRMHVMMSHKKSSPSKASTPPDVPLGFQDLGYVADISCDKFPLIAQEWCERNVRRCNSIAHRFICSVCSKAFPCSSALDLHKEKNHAIKANASKPKPVIENAASPSKEENLLTKDVEPTKENKHYYNKLRETFPSQEEFMATLLLKPNPSPNTKVLPNHHLTLGQPKMPSQNKALSSHSVPDDQSHADRDFADVGKILTLTTSASSNPLSMLKHLSKGAKQSPVKPSTLSSAFTSPSSKSKAKAGVFTASKPPPAHSHFPGQYKAHIRQADNEPRSADPATEMHFPTEVARDECKMESAATTSEETASDIGTESEPMEPEKTKEDSEDDKGNKKVGKYVCKYCQESFLQYSSLKIHLRTHMGLTPFKCLLCDYSSADKSTLVRHMRTHSGERPYSCKICDFPFTTKANCERHIKKRHGKASKLDIEMTIIHNSAGSAGSDASTSRFRTPDTFCKHCNREFRFFRDLQNHLKVHQRTPSKPFFCLKCQTGFSSKNNCSRHIIKCHPEITKDDVDNYMMVKQMEVQDITQTMANSFASNGEQLSPIDFSKKSPLMVSDSDLSDQSWLSAYTLPNLTDLDAPIDLSLPKDKSSSSFLPPVDSSLGRLRFKRVYHKFYSKTLDALVCPHCSKSFKRGSIFKEHIRSHTTERPHRCYYCKAAFTMKESLEKHIERRHSDESKSESPAQSFIPKIATPMQFKLMSRSSQGLRVRISLDNIDNDPVVKPDVEQQTSNLQSPGSSFGSDASGELASVSKILAASSNNFQVCFPQTGGQAKQEGEMEKEEYAKDEELSIKEEFLELENPTNTAGNAEWDQAQMQDVDLAEEYDLVIDESLASSSEAGDGQELNKTKERSSERDRSNLPTKEMCPYCNRKFPWISSLRRHILTHTGLKPFQCPQCNSSFSTKSNCERHIVRRHCLNVNPGSKVPENPFSCLEGCTDSAYSTKLKLMKHYEVKHVGIPFPECYKNEVKKLPASVIRNALAKRANKLSLSRSFGNSEFKSKVGFTGTTLKLSRHKQFLKRRHSSVDDKPLALVKKNSNSSASTSEVGNNKSHEFHSKKKHSVSVKGKPFPIIFKKKKKHKLPPSMVNGSDTTEDQASDKAAGDLLATDDTDLITANQANVMGEPSKQPAIRSKSKRKHARHCCSQCCKRFKSATTLKRHYRVHTLEHPFRCAECSASFTTKFNCQRHMLKLHGKSKEETLALIEKQRAEMTPGIPATKQQKAMGNQEFASQQNGQESGADHGSQLGSSKIPNGVSNPDVTPSRVKGTRGKTDGEKQAEAEDESKENPSDDEADAMEEENGDLDGDDFGGVGEEMEFDDAILDSDPEASNNGSVDFEATWDGDSGIGPSDDLYHPAETRDCSIISPSGRGRDVFVSGQTDNSDMIQNLLGIQDSSVLDEMLDSADSAAKLLGVE